MKIPRPLLIRIRRAIRRQLAMQQTFIDPLSADEVSNLQGPPPNPMKKPLLLLVLVVVCLGVLALTGCVTSITKAPDGSVTTIKAPAPGVLQFAGAAITAYSPRPIVIREEKSGRITPAEIERRWRSHRK